MRNEDHLQSQEIYRDYARGVNTNAHHFLPFPTLQLNEREGEGDTLASSDPFVFPWILAIESPVIIDSNNDRNRDSR